MSLTLTLTAPSRASSPTSTSTSTTTTTHSSHISSSSASSSSSRSLSTTTRCTTKAGHARLYATLTSSTRICRTKTSGGRRGHVREYGTHYRVEVTRRRVGKASCRRCDRGVRFDKRVGYKVYDVRTGEIVESGEGEVDFVGGKPIGFLWGYWEDEPEAEGGEWDWEDDVTVWEIDDAEDDLAELDGLMEDGDGEGDDGGRGGTEKDVTKGRDG